MTDVTDFNVSYEYHILNTFTIL